jgi:ATP-dependent DNA helicase RecG
MHRDYSEAAHGTQVRVEMYPDRIEIESPGGLYGPVSTEALLAGDSLSSSRNAALAKLLEDVVGDDGQAIAENRGTGIAAMQSALRDADLAPLELDDQIRRFVVRFRNATLIDEETLGWIAGLGQQRLSQRQIAALALARRGATLTNARYRAVAGCDTATATRELGDLRDRGVLAKTGAGQRVAWRLAPTLTSVPSSEIGLPGRFTGEIRRQQIRRLLELGDRSSKELSEATGLTKQSVRNYLNDLRSAGIVEPTSEHIRSPATRWRLTQRFDREAERA